MISDSLRAKHCPPGGNYQLGGHDIEIGEDGLARLKGTDTIAGSTLNMNKGLKILVEQAMVPFDAALNSCTINPARCLGADNRKGQNSNRLRRRPCHPRRQLRRNPNLLQRNPDAIVITITLIIPVP